MLKRSYVLYIMLILYLIISIWQYLYYNSKIEKELEHINFLEKVLKENRDEFQLMKNLGNDYLQINTELDSLITELEILEERGIEENQRIIQEKIVHDKIVLNLDRLSKLEKKDTLNIVATEPVKSKEPVKPSNIPNEESGVQVKNETETNVIRTAFTKITGVYDAKLKGKSVNPYRDTYMWIGLEVNKKEIPKSVFKGVFINGGSVMIEDMKISKIRSSNAKFGFLPLYLIKVRIDKYTLFYGRNDIIVDADIRYQKLVLIEK